MEFASVLGAKLEPCWPPFSSQDAPKTPQDAPRTLTCSQKGSKIGFLSIFASMFSRFRLRFGSQVGAMLATFFEPRRPKTTPGRPQDAPRRPQDTQRRPKTPQGRPQDAPRRPQDTQRHPKTPQDTPKTPPRRPKPSPDHDFGKNFGEILEDFG